MTRILILCTGNSCRSQMAEAFLKSFDPTIEVGSAGTKPGAQVHPKAIAVMKEDGIELSGKTKWLPKKYFKIVERGDVVAPDVCP